MALAMIEHVETYYGTRDRKRRPADRKILRDLVENVVANLAWVVVDEAGGPKTIAVALSKSTKLTRYDRRIYGPLPRILPVLHGHEVLTFRKSDSRQRRSTIEPTAWFRRKVVAAGVGLEDFDRAEITELIVLSRTKPGFSADGAFGKKHSRISYDDTAETRRFRGEMEHINAFLATADIDFVPDPSSPTIIDPKRGRTLHRTFNLPPWQEDDTPRFDQGGRLFGGWWENLPKEERRRIRLNGEPVVDLDFSSMFLRLAFLKLGVEPPAGDLYADIPGLEDPRWRPGIKTAANTLLFVDDQKQRMPSEIRKQLPPGWTIAKFRDAILTRYPDLEPIIETGLGYELFFTESQIMVTILLQLIDEQIPALPLHDGLLAPGSKKERVTEVMGNMAEKVTGFRLPTAVKPIGV